MYCIIEVGSIFDHFSQNVFEELTKKLVTTITERYLKEKEGKDNAVIGASVFADVKTVQFGKNRVFIIYKAHFHDNGMFDTKIRDLIIFDEIPDIVLDKINSLKKNPLEYVK